jgi:hypothetical protein
VRSPWLIALAMGACVLPDRGIVIVDEDVQNKHPVRFVESIQLTEDAKEVCDAELKAPKVCQPGEAEDALPAFLDPSIKTYQFCACDLLQEDTRKLPATTLYVEDRKNDVGQDLANIYAALQLDIDADETEPYQAVAYREVVNPDAPLRPTDVAYAPPKRPPENAGRELRALRLGEPDRPIDLCNGASNRPLDRGFHTLRIIITDLPWFNPGVEDTDRQPGVPDLAGGATFDTLSFTFYCDDKTNPEGPCATQCQDQVTE